MNPANLNIDHIAHRATNRSVSTNLMAMFVAILILFSIAFVILFRTATLSLLHKQVELRAATVTQLLAAAVLPHVAVRDYLSINKVIDAATSIPGIGYAIVINNRGMAIAGAFGEIKKFAPELITDAKKNGFPPQFVTSIQLVHNVNSKIATVSIGGQDMIEYAMRLNGTEHEVHLGVFTDDLMSEVYMALIPYLILLVITIILGALTVFFSARSIAQTSGATRN